MTERIGYGGLQSPYSDFESARIVVLPVPYDGTSTWGKGADKGPYSLFDASANMELYDIETDSQVYTLGIHTADPVEASESPEAMVDAVRHRIDTLLDKDKFVVTIGGEHSVSIGAIAACAARYSDLTVLQLDAHSDLRDSYEGSKNNHACVMARAAELCNIVQVGIRSMDVTEKPAIQPGRVFFAETIYDHNDWFEAAIGKLGDHVYVTVDLDVFDSSEMSSTGTPEPGGLRWYQVLSFLRELFKNANVIGCDVVELCPNERNRAPDFLAAKLVYKMLSYKFMDF